MTRQELDRVLMREERFAKNAVKLKRMCGQFETRADVYAANEKLNNTFSKRDHVMSFYNDYNAAIKADTILINALEGDGINAFEAETTFKQSEGDRAEIAKLKEHREKSRVKLAACRRWLEDYGVRF